MRGREEIKECTLLYPEHQLSPEDFLHFVELDEFQDDWKQLGLDVEEDLWALQIGIMTDPTGPQVEPGTGGLRRNGGEPANVARRASVMSTFQLTGPFCSSQHTKRTRKTS